MVYTRPRGPNETGKGNEFVWPDYEVEITDQLQPGENLLELRLTNTLVNLLEAVERPSGLSAAPSLVPYQLYIFTPS